MSACALTSRRVPCRLSAIPDGWRSPPPAQVLLQARGCEEVATVIRRHQTQGEGGERKKEERKPLKSGRDGRHYRQGERQRVRRFFALLDDMEKKVERLARDNRPPFNGERFLTDRELSGMLKISRRCLQDYRDQGRIPYIQLGGKILYRQSDIGKAAGGELSPCIGIISYLSLRIVAGIAFTIPPGALIQPAASLPAAGFLLSISRFMSEDIFRSVTWA